MIGPPSAAPNSFCRYGAGEAAVVGEEPGPHRAGLQKSRNGSRASNALFRTNSQPEPWNSLVPDFETRLTTPPITPPNSVFSLCDCTLNSLTASIIGSTP